MTSQPQQPVGRARSEPAPRGWAVLSRFQKLMLRIDRAVEELIPPRFNPFTQTGAIATIAFLVCAISGVVLLVWYRPSVHQAYESVLLMEEQWLASFLRSLHRYSADVCIFFVFIHGLRLFFAGRFTGARWLAWVTGVTLVAALWFVGWTGYLLIWDEPAQLVAEGSARFLDVVPLFGEPLSRSFLADELVPSLLFFVIFFVHMLVPLAMAVGLWLHVARLQRPRILTSRWMTLWVVGAMVALSVVFPASAQAPADAGATPGAMSIDAWYLAPLWLTDRLSAGMLWAIVGIGTALLVGLPWLLRRDEVQVASVDAKRCNGCTLCARDCPYDAIVMVPRDDDRRYELQARLDPAKCVGCGICAGACDPGGIGLDWLPTQATRKRLDQWIDTFVEESRGEGPIIAFLCSDSAAADLRIDSETGRCNDLPGMRAVAVPCAGWVQRLTIERALRRGAAGVVIVGCDHGDPRFREGSKWTERRLVGTRKPALRSDKIDADRVIHLNMARTETEDFLEKMEEIRNKLHGDDVRGDDDSEMAPHLRYAAGGVIIAAVLSVLIGVGSFLPYPGPPEGPPELIFSLKHYGQLVEDCRPLSEEERANQPIHMQRDEICDRRRSQVIVEVEVDQEVIHRSIESPGGISGDGPAVTLDRLEVAPGRREVTVRIADDGDDQHWNFEGRWTLDLDDGGRRSILFDTHEHFRVF